MNIIFRQSVHLFRRNVFLYNHRPYTYNDIALCVEKEMRKWIIMYGVQKGHRVILGHGNTVDFVVKLLTAWELGAVPVPMHPDLPIQKHHIDLIRPYMIDRQNQNEPFFFPDHGVHSCDLPGLAMIMFTSGTTSGTPKAIPLTSYNILHGMKGIGEVFPEEKIGQDDTSHAFLPWYHIYGLVCNLLFLMSRGGRCIIRNKEESVASFLHRIRYTNPTLLFCIPKFLESVHTISERYAWLLGYPILRRFFFGKNIRMISSGGAVLHPHVFRTIHEHMKIDLHQGYGLTECSPMVCLEEKPENSIGRLLPHMHIRIHPETGIAEVSGKSLFAGYLQTDGSIHRPADKFTKDGWFITGDRLAERDGRYYYIQREGTMFKLNNGKFVDPVWMENEIMQMGCFETVIVIPDGHHRHVVVVGRLNHRMKGKKDIILQEIRTFLHDKTEPYALPQQWIDAPHEMTTENGLLTLKMEPNRMRLRSLLYGKSSDKCK